MNERIKELRKAIGITQQELADKLGLKRNTIATYEIGKRFRVIELFPIYAINIV